MALMKEDNAQLSRNPEYDELLGTDPQMEPFVANEEPSEEEQIAFDELYADFVDELQGPVRKQVEKILQSSPELYEGVSKAAFHVLRKVYREGSHKYGEIPPATMFGEGAMIQTAVDTVFQMAQANGLPGADDQNQYVAAQMNMSKLVGEYIQDTQEDGAVEEAQSLLVDVEEMHAGNQGPGDITTEELQMLERGATPAEPMPEEVPTNDVMAAEQPSDVPPPPPAGGGLI